MEIEEEIEKNKDVQLSLLQDVLGDVRDQRAFFKKLCVILCSFVFLLIFGFVGLSLHNQNVLKDVANENTALFLNFLEKADVQIDTTNIKANEYVRTDKNNK